MLIGLAKPLEVLYGVIVFGSTFHGMVEMCGGLGQRVDVLSEMRIAGNIFNYVVEVIRGLGEGMGSGNSVTRIAVRLNGAAACDHGSQPKNTEQS